MEYYPRNPPTYVGGRTGWIDGWGIQREKMYNQQDRCILILKDAPEP